MEKPCDGQEALLPSLPSPPVWYSWLEELSQVSGGFGELCSDNPDGSSMIQEHHQGCSEAMPASEARKYSLGSQAFAERLRGLGPPVKTSPLWRRDRHPSSPDESVGLRTTSAKGTGHEGSPHTCRTVSLGVCSQGLNGVISCSQGPQSHCHSPESSECAHFD